MAEAGIINGMGDGTVAPTADIDRASTMSLFDKAVAVYAGEPGEYDVSGSGIVIVAAPGVTLSGELEGSVLVAAGTADGAVTLDNATVTGTVTVASNAEVTAKDSKLADVAVTAAGASVALTGKSEAETVTVAQSAEEAAVTVAADAKAGTVVTEAPKASLTVAGTVTKAETAETAAGAAVTVEKGAKVDTVTAAAPDSAVNVAGTVSKVETAETATGAKVETEKGASIKEVVANAEGTTVTGEAKVDKVTANADNTAVSTPNTKVEAGKDTTGVTVGDKEVKPGSSTTTNSSGTGTTSGSSSSGSSGPSYTVVNDESALKSAVANGGYIRVGSNFELTEEVAVSNTVVLDLNGKVLTFQSKADNAPSIYAFNISAQGNMTLNDSQSGGKIVSTDLTSSGYCTRGIINCRGTFTMNGGTIQTGKYNYWAVGCVGTDCNMTINGGTIDGGWTDGTNGGGAIAANGIAENGGYTLKINSGAVLKGGETTVYLPSAGNVTINGGTIESALTQAVSIRAGNLTVNGGELISHGARKIGATSISGNSGNYTGALVVVKTQYATQDGYLGDIVVDVKGGKLTNDAPSGDALVVVHENKSGNEEAAPGTVKVALSDTVVITGGMNIQDGFGAVEGDSLTLDGAAWVFSSKSLAAALECGGDILLGGNVVTDSILFIDEGKDVTLDLNGYKITTSMNPVGVDAIMSTYIFVNNGTFTVIGTTVGSSVTTGYTENPSTQQIRLFRNQSGNLTIMGGTYTGYYVVDNNTMESVATGTTTIMGSAVLNGGFACIANWKNGAIIVDGAELNADYYVLCNNGTYGGTSFHASNATMVSRQDTAIYFPAGDELELTNCVVNAPYGCGIEAFSGSVMLKGSTTINAGAEAGYQATVSPGGEGSRMDGSAVLLGYRKGYKTTPEGLVFISEAGVTLNSTNSSCIRLVALGDYSENEGVAKIDVTYDAGTLGTHGSEDAATDFRNDIGSSYGGTVTINGTEVHPVQIGE